MADIDVVVQSFLNSGRRITVTIDEAATVSQLKSAISSEEGVDTSIMKLLFNSTLLENSDTLDAVNIVDGSFINTSNNISQLATKENKQVAKLDLSALIRAVNGNPRATYDITQLPTRYSGNTVVVNTNEGGLVLGRPWIFGSELDATLVMSLDADGYSGAGNWLDGTDNNNDATLEGTPSYSATAPKFFDLVPGDGDYFSVADSATLDTMTEISIEMWINIDTVSSSGPNMLFSKRGSTSDGYVAFFTTSGWTFRFGTGAGTGLTYGTAPATGEWQHVVATIGSSGSNLYINGVEEASSAYTGDSDNVNTSAALDLFEVNPRPQTGPVRMDGKVAVFNIYDGVLSVANVTSVFDDSKARFGL